ncbi:MAG: choice-of-anchor D domain-containing protein [Myxococcota bacterium]
MKRLLCLSLGLAAAAGCGDSTGLVRVRARIEVTPNPIQVPPAAVGTSTEATFLVRNLGNDTLNVTSITLEGPPQLSVQPTSLIVPSLEDRPAKLHFAPTDLSVIQATLVLRSNDPDLPEARIPVIASPKTGAVLLICVASADVPLAERCSEGDLDADLGSIPLGGAKSATVSLRNVGDALMQVSFASLDIASAPGFAMDTVPLPLELRPGERVMTAVRFRADQAGAAAATAVFQANGDTRRVRFLATGLPRVLCLAPPVLDFGRRAVGAVVTSTAHASACGPSAIEVDAIEITEGASVFSLARPLTAPIELAPVAGLDLSIPVVFSPTAPGPFHGKLRVSTPGGEATIDLLGAAGTCDLSLDPMSVDLPTTGEPRTVLIRSTGSQACTLNRVELARATDSGFSIVSAPNTPVALAPSATATVVVQYVGAGGPLGARAELVVSYASDLGAVAKSAVLSVAPTPLLCTSGSTGTSWRSTLAPRPPPPLLDPVLGSGLGTAQGCAGDPSVTSDPSTAATVVSSVAHVGGRWYFEAKTDLYAGAAGVTFWASPAEAWTMAPVFMRQISAAGVNTSSVGIVSALLDLDSGVASFYVDGVATSQADVLLIPGVGAFHAGGISGWGTRTRYNFGAEAFAYQPPPGYQAWSGPACATSADPPPPSAPVDALCDNSQPCGGLTAFESAAQDPTQLIVLGLYDSGSAASWVWGTDAQGNPIQVPTGAGHNGSTLVRVQRPGRIHLVLSAYEPTDWTLEVAPGSTLAAISLYGMHLQTVTGVPSGTPLEVHTICTGGDGGNCPGFTGENFPVAAHQWPFDIGGGDTQGFIDMVEAQTCLPLRIFGGASMVREFVLR